MFLSRGYGMCSRLHSVDSSVSLSKDVPEPVLNVK